jgi:predicted SprT family Zn-dependent metalloprotease
MHLADAHMIALSLMARHGLAAWRFVWDNSKRRFGVCKYGPKEIGLSRYLVELNGEDEVRNTILHEIAHALAPGKGHGWGWKAKALEVGARPERCYSLEKVRAPKLKYEGTCAGCGWKCQRGRRGNLVHKSCGGKILWRLNGLEKILP